MRLSWAQLGHNFHDHGCVGGAPGTAYAPVIILESSVPRAERPAERPAPLREVTTVRAVSQTLGEG